jgi:hypothetical protein
MPSRAFLRVRWIRHRGTPAAAATRDKTAHILLWPIGLIVSLQSGNVIEFPCFCLKHSFEFHPLV